MGNEFMNLSINANGFSNVQNTAAGHKAEQANKQGKSAFFAGSPVLTTKNQIEQRKKMAQKSALKLVKDAWDNDQAVEKTVCIAKTTLCGIRRTADGGKEGTCRL